MPIGLKRGTVSLEPHDPSWKTQAYAAITKLKTILKDDIVDIQHVGSTAISGILAKPIIDLTVGVRSFDDILKHNEELERNGIVYRRQDHPNQHLYVMGDLKNDIQTHFIHVVIFGSKEWQNYIGFRDYLKQHKDEAQEYSFLKEKLAQMYPNDRKAYTEAKNAFIKKILHMS